MHANQSSARTDKLERRLAEAWQGMWDTFVDPREPFSDEGGGWLSAFGDGRAEGSPKVPYMNEQQLRDIREQCRALAIENEFAINGHENRISYLVGPGHRCRATVKKGRQAATALVFDMQQVLDDFLRDNCWYRRQQEIVRRYDRDGEVFLRFFVTPAGHTRVRFVEPGQIACPQTLVGDPSATFGVMTEPDDVETPLAYYIDGQPVDAGDIQHRKANVDANVKRGLPLFYPVRKNLRRVEKLLRNMTTVAEIQSAIALVRRHRGATRSGVEQFVASQADASVTSCATGQTSNFRRFAPGTILDSHGGIEYDFPTAGLEAGNYVQILQAELRAIASRLVMPEFMLTSDASNANYSSTMMAEGPAMRMFARLQAELVHDDLAVLWRVVEDAVAAGRLPREVFSDIEIQLVPPSLEIRDPLKEAQTYRIENAAGILSLQTWSQRRGLDYDQEQANLRRQVEQDNSPAVGATGPHSECPMEGFENLSEVAWDPSKHPRGGFVQNRGWFSSTGGTGSSPPTTSQMKPQLYGMDDPGKWSDLSWRPSDARSAPATPAELQLAMHTQDRPSNSNDVNANQQASFQQPQRGPSQSNTRVQLNIEPQQEESMDWYNWRAPAAGLEVGQTQTEVSGGWQIQRAVIDGKERFRVKYTLTGKAQIRLDPDKNRRLANSPRGMTLPEAYGHEQRHVQNFISTMKRGQAALDALASQEYDSAEAADAAAKKNMNNVTDTIKKEIRTDQAHETTGGPKSGEPKSPIGQMPKESKGVAR